MSNRAKWQKWCARDWEEIRGAWLTYIPDFPTLGARPDPGLERLDPLLNIDLPGMNAGATRKSDVEGLRRNTIWEAVFLFHKSAHVNLAAQRLAQSGMHSWCMFNAYHAAYLGAKGIMSILGVALPNLGGNQVGIDLFPEHLPQSKKAIKVLGRPEFGDFLVLRLNPLDQRDLWELFQRILRVSQVPCLQPNLRQNLLMLSYEDITPPRNRFLYKAHFWLLDDIASDAEHTALEMLVGTEMNAKDNAFLLRLSFTVHYLFEQLMRDLGKYSGTIRAQIECSRFLVDSPLSELDCYRSFSSQLAS